MSFLCWYCSQSSVEKGFCQCCEMALRPLNFRQETSVHLLVAGGPDININKCYARSCRGLLFSLTRLTSTLCINSFRKQNLTETK
jgi:hypothetical protein